MSNPALFARLRSHLGTVRLTLQTPQGTGCSPQNGKGYLTSTWQPGPQVFPRTCGALSEPRFLCLPLSQSGRLSGCPRRQETSHFWSSLMPGSPLHAAPSLLQAWNLLYSGFGTFSRGHTQCVSRVAGSMPPAPCHPCPRCVTATFVLGVHSVPRIAGQILNCISKHRCHVLSLD